MPDLTRVKTGVPGMDEITHGGIPISQTVLLTGTAGSGKTILAMQFAYNGAKKFKEPAVYLSFEESVESLKKNALNFGWDFRPLEKEELFSFIKYDPYHVDDVVNHLEARIREMNAKRVVIDSISALSFFVRDEAEYRRLTFHISQVLQRMQCTSMLLSEIVQGSPGLSRHGVEEFIADAVIVLYYRRINASFSRAVQIWKMRGTDHSEKLHPYKITSKGIEIYHNEEALMETKSS
jgi:KaiC/GvpD/RAD55 family RecA-like ATPase